MDVAILRAEAEHVDVIAPRFDAYRGFYGQLSDLAGAKRFLSERLEKQQSAAVDTERSPCRSGGSPLWCRSAIDGRGP
jgi:hypothetical protein